jgi:hypothetical protein
MPKHLAEADGVWVIWPISQFHSEIPGEAVGYP